MYYLVMSISVCANHITLKEMESEKVYTSLAMDISIVSIYILNDDHSRQALL